MVRPAARNLADLGASDFKLGKIGLTVGLSIVLVLALVLSPPSKATDAADTRVFRLPTTDTKYWAAMFIAGTLGTVIGDMASFDTGLGTAYASLLLGCVLGVVFLLGARGLFASMWFYWLAVDRKSTRLNSSHLGISYAVFCLKKKKKILLIPVSLWILTS